MTPAKLGPKLEEALVFAVRVHDGQLRKGTETPYVSHLLSVCALVLEDGGDEDEASAALLHDTLEDRPKEVTASDLARRFGADIWTRFKAPKADQLLYHRALVEAFRDAGAPDYLVDELDSLVRELETS